MKYPKRGISNYRFSKQLTVRDKIIHVHKYANNMRALVADSYYSRNLRHY